VAAYTVDDTRAQSWQRRLGDVSFDDMAEDAERFRSRARHCRELAETARDEAARGQLVELAHDLEDEADKIEAEEAAIRNASPDS
jgi:hypothetical protein